jgi:hypothetical protein
MTKQERKEEGKRRRAAAKALYAIASCDDSLTVGRVLLTPDPFTTSTFSAEQSEHLAHRQYNESTPHHAFQVNFSVVDVIDTPKVCFRPPWFLAWLSLLWHVC